MRAENKHLEAKIIAVARDMFIENGYAETSMSDIAEKVGVNRPVLHYYFRTKDRMFQAVFGTIIQSVVPEIEALLAQKDLPLMQRIERIVDAYCDVFSKNSSLPLFVAREIHRDANHLIETLAKSPVKMYISRLSDILQEEMREGRLKTVPVNVIFYTFYGLLTFPFLTKGLFDRIMEGTGKTFQETLEEWKPYMLSQMEHLLVK